MTYFNMVLVVLVEMNVKTHDIEIDGFAVNGRAARIKMMYSSRCGPMRNGAGKTG